MNKYQEALNKIKNFMDGDCGCIEDDEAKKCLDTLQELCNKEIPLKPILEKDEIGDRGAFGGTGYMTFTNAICPCCGEYLDEDKKDSRCQECGQLIDWTEDDDFYDEDEGDYD